MSIFTNKKEENAVEVRFEPDMLFIRLADGREVGVPLLWHPKLMAATEEQRKNWRLIGDGVGIRWEELDEDISIEGLL